MLCSTSIPPVSDHRQTIQQRKILATEPGYDFLTLVVTYPNYDPSWFQNSIILLILNLKNNLCFLKEKKY